MSRLFVLPVLALALGTCFVLWAWLGRQVEMPDVPGGRLECVSYTPWQGSENPLKHEYAVDDAILRASLTALRPLTGCIRLYSALGPYPEAVRIADELGLQVMQGIWIGRDEKLNRREIEAALELTASYPKTIRLLIVGNEVLLRREMSGDRLANIIRSVKARTTIPVAYADIPHFWRQNPMVAEAVDVIGIHLLPYWDDPTPVSIDRVQEHLGNLTAQMRHEFPSTPLLIAEVGWPTAGRTRGSAVPSRINQARFIREFSVWAAAEHLPYNLIEGWDQPWKKQPEGTVGGFWGILDRNLLPKFALAGPVSEWPNWRYAALFSAVVSTLLLLGPLATRYRPKPLGWFGLGLLGPALGSSLVGLGAMIEAVPSSLLGTIGIAGLFALTLSASGLIALHMLDGVTVVTQRPASFDTVIGWLRKPTPRLDPVLVFGIFRWATLVTSVLIALAIAFDGRHRDFPTLGLWLPGVALALHAARCREAPGPDMRREEAWLSLVLAIAGVFGIDYWKNIEAWFWAANCLLLAAPGLPASRVEALRLRRLLFQSDKPQTGDNDPDDGEAGVIEDQPASGEEQSSKTKTAGDRIAEDPRENGQHRHENSTRKRLQSYDKDRTQSAPRRRVGTALVTKDADGRWFDELVTQQPAGDESGCSQ